MNSLGFSIGDLEIITWKQRMKSKQDEKLGEAAAEIVSDTVHTLNELGIDQDYAAYLLLSAGMGWQSWATGIALSLPPATTSAMMVANQQIMHMEDDDNDKPKYH